MHNLFKKRTVIIIAHRFQTVKDASEIILFENGEIKEK
jgi:ABC-type multidrug transport system fused ATPase/permease subunit